MRRALICIAAMMVWTVGGVSIARGADSPTHSHTPTRAQIRRAVAHAERSRYLWATINICKPHVQQGGFVGVRGEMVALGFRSTLSMTVQLRQYDRSRHRFVDVKGSTARRTVTLGPLRRGVHQDGAEFHYAAGTGRLDATVTFSWRRHGRRLGHVTRRTTSGHHSAAFGEPAGHSAANCRL